MAKRSFPEWENHKNAVDAASRNGKTAKTHSRLKLTLEPEMEVSLFRFEDDGGGNGCCRPASVVLAFNVTIFFLRLHRQI
jgi:hypothetical protein